MFSDPLLFLFIKQETRDYFGFLVLVFVCLLAPIELTIRTTFLQANDVVNSLVLELSLAWEREGFSVSGYSCLILKASLSARQS